MRIAILVEGKTEKAFIPYLRKFLETRLSGRMPKLDCVSFDHHLPTKGKLKRVVENLLNGKPPADAVIALTDVYTGTHPPEFVDAADAKSKMMRWADDNEHFHPHAAQHDFEAWLLPYWDEIKKLAGNNRSAPRGAPESINHDNPPAHRIQDLFRTGHKKKTYVKPRDAGRILRNQDLTIAAQDCPELKSLLNTILRLCGGEPVS